MGSTRPNPTHVNWVGLGWTYVMSWVGLNFFWPTMMGWVKKFPQPNPTRPMHTPTKDHLKDSHSNLFVKALWVVTSAWSPTSSKIVLQIHFDISG